MTPRIYISVPVNDFIHTDFVPSYLNLALTNQDLITYHGFTHGTCPPEQRLKAVRHFLEGDHTHLLFLDSDMVFPASALRDLLSLEVPLAAVNYRKRKPPYAWTCTTSDFTERVHIPEVPNYYVANAGTGCMLVERSLLKGLSEPAFDYQYLRWTRTHGTEDVYFTQKVYAEFGIRPLIHSALSTEIGHLSVVPITARSI